LFLAAVLGPQKAFLAVLTFLLEGLSGLPVFALGHLGLPTLMGPTGGYLLSYLPISLAVGCLFRINKPSSYSAVFLNLLVGMFGILILGSLWLSNFVGLNYFIPMGITPFILPGLAKTAVLAFIVQRVKN